MATCGAAVAAAEAREARRAHRALIGLELGEAAVAVRHAEPHERGGELPRALCCRLGGVDHKDARGQREARVAAAGAGGGRSAAGECGKRRLDVVVAVAEQPRAARAARAAG